MADAAPKTGQPFDDIRALVESMPQPDDKARLGVQEAFDNYSPTLSAFGSLAPALTWLAGWQGKSLPAIDRPLVAVFAGTHDVAREYMSDDPVRVAKRRVQGMTERKAAVRGIAAAYGAAFKVYEMGIEYPAANLTQDASLSERECAAAIAFGMEVVAEGADLIVLGNAGFGSATAAAAIALGLYGGTAEYWAGGRAATTAARIEAVKKGVALQRSVLSDPLEVLRCFGGRDIAGLMGAIIAARHQSIPIILDGYVVCAAAAVLHRLDPSAIDHCYAGHVSSEPAHGALLDRMGLEPLQSFDIGIGDGTGGALAMGVLKAAASGLRTITE